MPPELTETLRRRFGHDSFRPGQEEAVRAVLAGRDVLAVMPTGSGKSILYQLPALLSQGLTLVVSPLIALMKDQVDELTRKGIAAAALHSMLASSEKRDVLNAARRGALKLLYVAPERFGSELFFRDLPELRVSLFAVDEAHCVSEWGHDFRPDYLRLADAAARCGRGEEGARPPLLAVTATATPEVRDDIVALLKLSSPSTFVAGFDRPNIVPSVVRVSGEREKRILLPRLVEDRRALVYAATRKSSERAAAVCEEAGIAAAAYHAGLPDAERVRVQDGFVSGELKVICATNAFGMGIDRPDVDAVVHFELPGSLEAYYQEIGRAGRDGRTAYATLLWNYIDVKTREFLIEREDPEEDARWRDRPRLDRAQRERSRELDRIKLRRMVAYADSRGCLRAITLRYFGEKDTPETCGSCGSCDSRRVLSVEELLLVRKVLSGVARAKERWGRKKIASMLVGDLDELPDSLRELSTTGLLALEGRDTAERWLDAALGGGLLRATDDTYRTLSLTPIGREVMSGRVTDVTLAVTRPVAKLPRDRKKSKRGREAAAPASAARNGGTSTGGAGARPDARPAPDPALLDALRAWRREEAARRKVPAYVVFHDRTLEELAALRPTTLRQLEHVPGIGPKRLTDFGAAVLGILSRA